MLFNSLPFLFGFLPITLAGFFFLARRYPSFCIPWLTFASVAFYCWWDISYLGILLASICVNYSLGLALAHTADVWTPRQRKLLLTLSITLNLALLAYYKYWGFFSTSALAFFTGEPFSQDNAIQSIPLGISFFTFTQIAFLVDVYRQEVEEYNLINYGLFVTYFPHLIAGPILHHKEMMPQFGMRIHFLVDWNNIASGLSIFAVGLFKKVVLADTAGIHANKVFDAAAAGTTLDAIDSWSGALAYTLQLYFDFSGYSDMAIGLSLLFNIRLPLNFYSPYKATSIIEFWRRWHITLSRFLKDYLYVPLGGNRRGIFRRYINLGITMLLGGLWHGAGWTFVIWGGLHGIYLMINHAWRSLFVIPARTHRTTRTLIDAGSCALTFVCVVVAWVFFRAESIESAMSVLRAMAFFNGVQLPSSLDRFSELTAMFPFVNARFSDGPHLASARDITLIAAMLTIVWALPNTFQIFGKQRPALAPADLGSPSRFTWAPTRSMAICCALLMFFSLISLSKHSPFLYFQF